jgi:GTP-binding protein
LHVLDAAPLDGNADPVAQARTIAAELRKYDLALTRIPRWYVLNKIDLIDAEARDATVARLRRRLRTKAPVFAVSAVTGEGCRDLMWAVQRFLAEHAAAAEAAEAADPHLGAAAAASRVG